MSDLGASTSASSSMWLPGQEKTYPKAAQDRNVPRLEAEIFTAKSSETKTLMFGFHVSFCLGCRGFRNIPKKNLWKAPAIDSEDSMGLSHFQIHIIPFRHAQKKSLDITSRLPWLQTFEKKHPKKGIILLTKNMFHPTTAYSALLDKFKKVWILFIIPTTPPEA